MSYISSILLGYTEPVAEPVADLATSATASSTASSATSSTASSTNTSCIVADIDQSRFIDELLEEKRKQILDSKRDRQLALLDHTSDEKDTSNNKAEPASVSKSPQTDMNNGSGSRSKPRKRKPVKNIAYKQVTSDLSKEMEQLLLSDSE